MEDFLKITIGGFRGLEKFAIDQQMANSTRLKEVNYNGVTLIVGHDVAANDIILQYYARLADRLLWSKIIESYGSGRFSPETVKFAKEWGKRIQDFPLDSQALAGCVLEAAYDSEEDGIIRNDRYIEAVHILCSVLPRQIAEKLRQWHNNFVASDAQEAKDANYDGSIINRFVPTRKKIGSK
jgi:hypothetical protein